MTVPQNPNTRTEAVGNGVTLIFAFDFLCLEARDIQVSVSDVLLAPSQYTVTGLGQLQGGTVSFVSAPANGAPILMELAVVAARAIDYQDNGDLFAQTVNFDFDRLWLAIKSAFGWMRRALVLGTYDVDGAGSYRANNNRIQDLADPTAPQDAVNQRSMFSFVTEYVDKAIAGVVGGFGWFLQAGIGAIFRTFQDKMRDTVSVKDFGAKGDGMQVESMAIQRAIDYAASLSRGGSVVIPPGLYRLDQPIAMRSMVRVVCDIGAVFDASESSDTQGVVKFVGSAGSEVPLASPLQRGGRSISLASTVDIKSDDLLHLVGQRNCLSPDAGEAWRLGLGTPGSLTCYFGEFLISASTGSLSTINIGAGPVFPNYLTTASGETDPNARPRSTVRVIAPVKDAHFIGGKFTGLNGKNTVFFSQFARDCTAEDSVVDKGLTQGSAVFWTDSYRCDAIRVQSYFDPALDYPESDHHKYNSFKTAGAQRCHFIECGSEFGAQNVDFSYLNFGTPSIDCTVRSGKFNYSKSNPITTHPGTYRINVLDNECFYCQGSGISIRSRGGVISRNTVTGDQDIFTAGSGYGISMYAGWARDNTISDNVVDGFNIGLYEWDSSNLGQQFNRTGNKWIGNTVKNVVDGVQIYAHPNFVNATPRGSLFEGNSFMQVSRNFFRSNAYCPGVVFKGNHLFGPHGAGQTAVFVAVNCPWMIVADNYLYSLLTGVNTITMNAVSDLTTYPTGANSCEAYGNKYFGATPTFNISSAAWKPSYVEYNGANASVSTVAAPLPIPGYAQRWVDSTDNNYKIKWPDNTIKTIVTKV